MTSSATTPTVLSSDQMASLPKAPLGSIQGVTNAVLWTDGVTVTGILVVEAGHQLGSHTHRTHQHDMWVLSGTATIAGRRLGPNSYVHIPAGIEHDIDATESNGVTVYYSYALPTPASS